MSSQHTGQWAELCYIWWLRLFQQSCDYNSSEGHTHNISEHKIDSHKYEMCNKSFKKCRYVDLHMQLHLGHEPFSCTICNRCSSHSNHLTLHLCTHTGNKPYSCDICRRSLSVHMEDLLHIDMTILERNPSDV
jgi:uncharacterized Zn-finger protein